MMRKWPGKICRRAAVSPPPVPPQGSRFQKFTQQNQSNRPEKRHGIDLA
jgi:hypothetical protein